MFTPVQTLAGTHLVVVEDETDNRELLVFVLENEGAEVTAVESAQQALAVLEQVRPDVLLCDISLPGKDGCQLLREWREREAQLGLPPIPAIAVTAMVRELDKQYTLQAGFQLHISKPCDFEKLPRIIAGFIRVATAS